MNFYSQYLIILQPENMTCKDIPSEAKINCTLCSARTRLRAMRKHLSVKHGMGILTVKCTIQDDENGCFWKWSCANTFECFLEHVLLDHPNFKINGSLTEFTPENGFKLVKEEINYIEHSKVCDVVWELHADDADMKRKKKLALTINSGNKKRKISEVEQHKNQIVSRRKISRRSPIKNIKKVCNDIITNLVDVLVDAVEEFDEDVEDLDEVVEIFDDDDEEFVIVEETYVLEANAEIKAEAVDETEVIEIVDEDDENELYLMTMNLFKKF